MLEKAGRNFELLIVINARRDAVWRRRRMVQGGDYIFLTRNLLTTESKKICGDVPAAKEKM